MKEATAKLFNAASVLSTTRCTGYQRSEVGGANGEKTKKMTSSRSEGSHNNLQEAARIELDAVNKFIYLVSEEILCNDINIKVKGRIVLANKCSFSLSKLLRSTQLSKKTKVKLY